MKQSLVKEVAFGKATARITVEFQEVEKRVEGFEGIDLGTEINSHTKIEIVAPNGKVVTKDTVAVATGYNEVYAERFNQGGFDTNSEITIVGKAATSGRQAADEINKAIDEMQSELAAEFEVKTEKEIEQEEEIEEAKAVVKLAEKEGIENLKTEAELKEWRKRYNDLHNEGGEGYIPVKISKEKYEWAINILN